MSDWTRDEFKSLTDDALKHPPVVGSPKRSNTKQDDPEYDDYITRKYLDTTNIPKEIDWNKLGYVSPAKMQGKCGACYAFVAASAIESYWKIKHGGKLLKLSQQQLIDCSSVDGWHNQGCQGGSVEEAFGWAM